MKERNQPHMPVADTPPASPVEADSTASDISYVKPTLGSRIHIDDQGVHDFDFARRRSDGPNKLKKFGRRSNNKQRRIASMSDIPQRSSSDGSETASIRKRFSNLLSTTEKSPKIPSKNTQTIAETAGENIEDPLPETKKELEIRLNHHLSELDLLVKTINVANDIILQHHGRYAIFEARSSSDMKVALLKLEEMVEQTRINRDSYSYFVSFHRRQIERIKNKRLAMDVAAGLAPVVPEIYTQLWGDEEWSRLFAV